MRALRTVLATAVLTSTFALAADPCEPPHVRDVAPLMKAINQDRALGQAFIAAAQACAGHGDCDQAKANCTTALSDTLNGQVNFDEGWWIRDMMLPYAGRTYTASQPFAPSAPLTDVSCALDVKGLTDAGNRRMLQAERRSAILNEYPKFAKWANDQVAVCKANAAAEEARAEKAKADAEKLAAAATAAKSAEEARKQAEEDKKKKAEEEARRVREAQEAQAKKQREAIEEAKKQQEEAARKNAEAQERARLTAEERARREAEDRAVKEREDRKAALRAQKEQMLSQAEEQGKSEEEAAEIRRQKLLHQFAEEEAASKDAAAKRARDLRRKAEGIAVPDEDERSRASLAVAGGAGYSSISSSDGSASGVVVGGRLVGHLGFWGTAPASGIANGLEFRVTGHYMQLVTGGTMKEIEAAATLRYFAGPLGIGAAGEFRLYDTTLGSTAQSSTRPAFGPTIGIQMLDTPHGRVSLNAMWLPIGSTTDYSRVCGDLEISREVIIVDLFGGLQSDVGTSGAPSRSGWFVMGTLGIRWGM